MRIGHHRPLFCLCAVWMLAAGLGWVLSGFDGHRMLPAGAVCAGLAAGVLSVCLLLRPLRRITARRACAVGLALLCAGLSLLNSGAYFSGQVTPDSFPGLPADSGIPASDGAGEDAPDLPDAADAPVWEVRAVVAERLGGGSQITDYGLILRTVQGEPVGSALRPARAYLLCTYAANLQPGYEILLRAQAVTPEDAAGEFIAGRAPLCEQPPQSSQQPQRKTAAAVGCRKSLAEFAPAGANKVQSIFTSWLANVRA